MNSIVGAISVLAFSLPIAADESQADPGTPAEQCAALLREYRAASGAFRKASTDQQRKTAVGRLKLFKKEADYIASRVLEDALPGAKDAPTPSTMRVFEKIWGS